MPRVCVVKKEEAVEILSQFPDEFRLDPTPEYSAPIWETLAKKTPGKWTAKNWRTNVNEDRRNILTTVRQSVWGVYGDPNDPIVSMLNESTIIEEEKNEHEGVDKSLINNKLKKKSLDEEGWFSDVKYQVKDGKWFEVIYEPADWAIMKPAIPQVIDDKIPRRKSHTLRANSWTHIISHKFFLSYRKQRCAYSFKRAEVNISERRRFFIKIEGYCRSETCRNPFYGFVEDEPEPEAPLVMKIFTRDTADDEDHECLARWVTGEYRKEIGKQVLLLGPAKTQNKMAQSDMQPGEPINPFIPRVSVLGQLKKETSDKEAGMLKLEPGQDMVQQIYNLQWNTTGRGAIDFVAYSPFIVIYGSTENIDVYKSYRKLTKESCCISIDATGSIIKKIQRPNGTLSHHIFLYCIVIHENGRICSVYNMLSEIQTTEIIVFWLKLFQRRAGQNLMPSIVSTDYSRAILGALARSMAGVNLNQYMDICFYLITGKPLPPSFTITTYLTIDVAHLIKLICEWPCLQKLQYPRQKEFFVRCVGLLIDCQNLKDFETIFMLTYAVAIHVKLDTTFYLNPTDPNTLITVAEARTKLNLYLAERPKDEDNFLKIINDSSSGKSENIRDNEDIKTKSANIEDHEEIKKGPVVAECIDTHSASIVEYIHKLVAKVKDSTEGKKEDNENPYCLSQFAEKLIQLAYEFPLWTGVALPVYAGHSSSSCSEKNFDDVKNTMLKNTKGPINPYKFLLMHLSDGIGSARLFDADMNDPKKPIERLKPKYISKKRNNSCSSPEPSQQPKHPCPYENEEDYSSYQPLPEIKHDDNFDSIDNWRGKAGPPLIFSNLINLSFPDDKTWCNSTIDPDKLENFDNECDKQDTKPVLFKKNIPSSSKYFSETPELLKINQTKEKQKTKKVTDGLDKIEHFLPNGNNTIMKIGKQRCLLANTCGFDCLMYIMVKGAVDDRWYSEELTKSQSEIAQFLIFYLENGNSDATLLNRYEILKPLYQDKMKVTMGIHDDDNVYTFDCEDFIEETWKKLFLLEPSAVGQVECEKCRPYEIQYPVLSPNHVTICSMGFGQLQNTLSFKLVNEDKKCRCGRKAKETMRANNTIFVSLYCQTLIKDKKSRTGFSTSTAKKTSLINFPTSLHLDTEYRLLGLVELLEKSKHFVAYCRRINGTWVLFNDLKTKVTPVKATKVITPSAAIYIRQIDSSEH